MNNNDEKKEIDYKELIKNKLVNRKTKTGTIYAHSDNCWCLWCSGKSPWVKGVLPIKEDKDQQVKKL